MTHGQTQIKLYLSLWLFIYVGYYFIWGRVSQFYSTTVKLWIYDQ